MRDWIKYQRPRFTVGRLLLATLVAAAAIMMFEHGLPRYDAGAPPMTLQIFALVMLPIGFAMLVLIWPRSSNEANTSATPPGDDV
jgi:hypothetical protein